MVWNLEPDDLPEPQDVEVRVCNDCHKYAGECECENSSGFTKEWGSRCSFCRSVFLTEDAWASHECSGYEPDENEYL
jgi:hypothetical protein